MNAREKTAALRRELKKLGIHALYVPSADPHLSEYLPDAWKHRAWLSGFTGSMGELLVGPRRAALWTDGRYFFQASKELAGSDIELMRMGEPGTPTMTAWIVKQLRPGQVLGVDASVVSMAAAADFENALAPHGIKVEFLRGNPIDAIWEDRPAESLAPVTSHPRRFAGETPQSKLARLRAAMKLAGTKAHVVCALDQVAWLLNIRADDIAYTPVVTAYAIVTDRACTLYVDPQKLSREMIRELRPFTKVAPYRSVWADLGALGRQRVSVWVDPAGTSRRVVDALKKAPLFCGVSPIVAMRAVKNPTQIKAITEAHRRDGVAMVRFLHWLEGAVRGNDQTEISASDQLFEFRRMGRNFQDNSFSTISGFGPHGSIIHYSATPKSNGKLKRKGIYLIDSGGQYLEGTTDITRTVAFGKPTPKQKEMFTRVLLGNIDCTVTPFPAGTTGQRQEMFARRHLWLAGRDYNHGTGHGVGQYLGVHEGPHSLKNIPTPPFVEGNLMSIEPGYYEDGRFGIRIENLAFVTKDEKLSTAARTWYRFHPVTLCPIDRKLIDKSLMTRDHVAWLDAYHKRVYRELAPSLGREEKAWLRKATRPL
ncbi:MAG: aminopeptidase P family protein [bacterium]|nr:aminopeptidase P family protein [bacterium]